MTMESPRVEVDVRGGVRLIAGGHDAVLHPLWLRERTTDPGQFDWDNRQRLFEPAALPADLRVTEAGAPDSETLDLAFSDGYRCRIALDGIARELGWRPDPQEPPAPEPWDAALTERPTADWSARGEPAVMRALLADFHRLGFCLLTGVPTAPGTLRQVAEHFGFLRETNFGALFDVVTVAHPIDLAYTARGLSAHADNPYRRPIPGIQLLHCLETTVEGGLSTLVDGFAMAATLEREAPEAVRVLCETPVRFRYESDEMIVQSSGPLIEKDLNGRLVRVRFSPRLDYVPPLPPEALDLFYAGRRRLFELAGDTRFEIRFRLRPGMVLMMDNHRLLHGRTAFDGGAGTRHLQGCYIDHDGPDTLYRLLVRDGARIGQTTLRKP